MTLQSRDYSAVRVGIAAIPADLSNDAVGDYAPKLEDIYAPETHASALDPGIPIVVGSRGAGKSFWSGVLGQTATREAAAVAYPRLGLRDIIVGFGFTGGVGGPEGVSVEALNGLLSPDASIEKAKAFWWATILRAAARAEDVQKRLSEWMSVAGDWEAREEEITRHERRLRRTDTTLLVVYDALDTVATNWPRRRLVTEALLEVVWAMRAYHAIKLKLFLRPDQIDDDALRFVELPKLRTGAVRLAWTGADLYGLLYARLALTPQREAAASFSKLLASLNIARADRNTILSRRWALAHNSDYQARVMEVLAGPFMADGPYGYKKGKTYDWPLKHLGDAFDEVTPRSFLGLVIAAAKRGAPPADRVITPDGIRHGLREASKTRVDQLHLEFPWIKGVLAPLAGLLLPQDEAEVYSVWRRARTIELLTKDAVENSYLPPFPAEGGRGEQQLFEALRRIGVMFRRKDERIDMPDLFRVAAKLLKKGGTAPL
ncbi:MAG TPA: hypothetical protein VJX94_22745 [Stellaceae bacterium]|nr:hypothetical protein [Stellaceae bacterium]